MSQLSQAQLPAVKDYIRQELNRRRVDFTEQRRVTIYVGSLNLGAQEPTDNLDAWLIQPAIEAGIEQPDVYAIGFQELVQLNAGNLTSDKLSQARADRWSEIIKATLNKGRTEKLSSYHLVLCSHLVGLCLLVFVSERHLPHTHNINGQTTGVGIMGMMGNKGACACRLQLYDSTLCFVCSHLAAHRSNVHGRNKDFATIISRTNFTVSRAGAVEDELALMSSEPDKCGILDNDLVVWLGDLNYRFQQELTMEIVQRCIAAGDLQHLWPSDQLNIERSQGRVFAGFEEGQLTFNPTYKYVPGSDSYDCEGTKMRMPAWTDRVLWHEKHPAVSCCKQLLYKSCMDIKLSDHRPIEALFDVQVGIINRDRQREVREELLRQLDTLENQSIPKIQLSSNMFKFLDLRFAASSSKTLRISNVGPVPAVFTFTPKVPEKKDVCESWCKISPLHGVLMPNAAQDVCITVCMDACIARSGCRQELNDIAILSVTNGSVHFVELEVSFSSSCFGASLEQLDSPNKHVCIVDDETRGRTQKNSKTGDYLWLLKANSQEDRALRRSIADMTTCAVERRGYRLGSRSKVCLKHVDDMLSSTRIISPSKGLWPNEDSRAAELTTESETRIHIERSVVYDVAVRESLAGKSVAAINAASAYHTGGGYSTGGRHALEEAMCIQSTLYQSLLAAERQAKNAGVTAPPWVRWHSDVHIPDDGCILSPKVEVFRDATLDGYPFKDSATILEAVISVAMPNCNNRMSDSPVDKHPDAAEYDAQLQRKWRAVLTAAACYTDADTLVIPDAGCGVFFNPPQEVGAAFRKVLRSEFQNRFKDIFIVFPGGANGEEFARQVMLMEDEVYLRAQLRIGFENALKSGTLANVLHDFEAAVDSMRAQEMEMAEVMHDACQKSDGDAPDNVPTIIVRLIGALREQQCWTEPDIFLQAGSAADLQEICNSLDSSKKVPAEMSVLAVAEALIELLMSLSSPIVPVAVLSRMDVTKEDIICAGMKLFASFSTIQHDTFVYIIDFLNDLCKRGGRGASSTGNSDNFDPPSRISDIRQCVEASSIAAVFSRCFLQIDNESVPRSDASRALQGIMHHLLVAPSIHFAISTFERRKTEPSDNLVSIADFLAS